MRLEAAAGGRGAMMATSPTAAGGLTVSGLPVRRSEEIADLIDLFSKMQYRAKEVTPRVRLGSGTITRGAMFAELIYRDVLKLQLSRVISGVEVCQATKHRVSREVTDHHNVVTFL